MKVKFLNPLLLLMLSVAYSNAFSQTETKIIGLQEAIELGLKNNSYLRISEANTKLAESRVQQVRDSNLPKAGASIQYSRIYTLSPFHLSPDIGLPATHFDAMIGLVSVSKEIFDGFLDKARHEATEALVKASKMDAKKDRNDIRYNIIALYYTIYKIGKSQSIIEQNMLFLTEREREAANMLKEGVLLSNDLLKIQLQKSNLALNKVDVKNAMDIALYNLAVMTGIADSQPIAIDTNVILAGRPLGVLSELSDQALLSRNEIKAAGYRVDAAEAGLKQLKSNYYPHLEASAMYVYLNPMVPHDFLPPKGGFLNAANFGLSVKYNIGSLYGMKGKMQESKLSIVQAQNIIEVQKDLIRNEVFSYYKSYQAALEKITVSKIAMDQASHSFKLSSSQFKNGLLLSGDLMQSQNLLLQSQLNELQARVDAQLAYFRLEKALGGALN